MTEVPSLRPSGTPCWASLMAHRADRALEFYGALFGWEYVPGPRQLGSYMIALRDGRRVAGIGEGDAEPHRPVSWTTMLASDDADAAAELARECGGTVGIGPLNADEAGRLAIAVDPSGAVFGIWQGDRLPGAEVTGEPGTVAWSELWTRDASLVAKFYQTVFGMSARTGEDGGMDRLLLTAGGEPVAGIRGVGRDLPRDRGAHWMTSFAVSDTDAAVTLAADLGARVLEPPRDSPQGRVATVADPEGAALTLVTPPPPPRS